MIYNSKEHIVSHAFQLNNSSIEILMKYEQRTLLQWIVLRLMENNQNRFKPIESRIVNRFAYTSNKKRMAFPIRHRIRIRTKDSYNIVMIPITVSKVRYYFGTSNTLSILNWKWFYVKQIRHDLDHVSHQYHYISWFYSI